MEDEKDTREPTQTGFEDQEKASRKTSLARLEGNAIKFLYSLIERPADSPWFWVATAVGMFLVLAGPMIAIVAPHP